MTLDKIILEMDNCKEDSVYFIHNYLKINTENGARSILLDTTKIKLLKALESNKKYIIGRYPRCYGKTITLLGFVLHKMLFSTDKLVFGYKSISQQINLDFLRLLSFAYHELPYWMKIDAKITESIYGISIGNSKLEFYTDRNAIKIYTENSYLILDEIQGLTNRDILSEIKLSGENRNAQYIVIGTFNDNDKSIIDLVNRKNSCYLPENKDIWKVETLMSLSKFAEQCMKGYNN